MENINIPTEYLTIVPIIAIIIQQIKQIDTKNAVKNYLPIIAVIASIGLAYLIPGNTITTWYEPILPAILIGLTTCGGYDALKAKA